MPLHRLPTVATKCPPLPRGLILCSLLGHAHLLSSLPELRMGPEGSKVCLPWGPQLQTGLSRPYHSHSVSAQDTPLCKQLSRVPPSSPLSFRNLLL